MENSFTPKSRRHLGFKIHAALSIALNLYFWYVWVVLEHAQTKFIWPIWATGIFGSFLLIHYLVSYRKRTK